MSLVAASSTGIGASSDWLRSLLDVARVAAVAAAFLPFPYIKAAASAIVELLQQIDVQFTLNPLSRGGGLTLFNRMSAKTKTI